MKLTATEARAMSNGADMVQRVLFQIESNIEFSAKRGLNKSYIDIDHGYSIKQRRMIKKEVKAHLESLGYSVQISGRGIKFKW